MSDPVRQALVKIIARHGHSVCDDPRRCEGLLRDVCGDYKREIFILINALKEVNIREKVKVAIGGGAITQEFADMIGADGYRPTAPMAMELFKEFIGVK